MFFNEWRKGFDLNQSIQDLRILGDIVCWRELLKTVTWLVTVDELWLPGWRQVVEKDVVLKCDAQVCFVVGIPNHESLDIKKIISSVRSIVVGVFYSVRVNQEITMGENKY